MNIVLKLAVALALAVAVPLAVILLLPVHDLTARVLLALVIPVWALFDTLAQQGRRVHLRKRRLRELSNA